MLLLSDKFLLDPAQIATVFLDKTETHVVMTNGLAYGVEELPLDIARMRAAWELRHFADKIMEEKALPIAIKYDAKDGYRFICCEHTARITAMKQKEAAADPTACSNCYGAKVVRTAGVPAPHPVPCPACA
ncbi:hypothetical protein GURKE_04260 [Brevundimonas phage vB_BpoS-Gurke]|uniref:Uncharacterized protein n=1 Tax=Brevundimonas phage vB_BpoS-Gurke TaxID=2948599 RepID=A0A9E7SQN9_9CAUD|nr:hypothetical protein GURKE_04260 [Brevundimonas phage vB_BpoS-Gurke]